MRRRRPLLSIFTFVIVAALFAVTSYSARALTLTDSQNPDPFQALEDTSGNIGFIKIANTGSSTIYITKIIYSFLAHTGGERDDEATNVVLVGPKPQDTGTVDLAAGGNFNIKFSWDAIDNLKDNDVDFGLWSAFFFIYGFVVDGPEETFTAVAHLRVNDPVVPLPPALPLFATGLGAFGLLGWRRKRKAKLAA